MTEKQDKIRLRIGIPKRILSIKEQQESLIIQTLIFSKIRFKTKFAVHKWVVDNKFRVIKSIDETPNTFRVRQKDPSKFNPDTYKTWYLTTGVQAVGAKLKK